MFDRLSPLCLLLLTQLLLGCRAPLQSSATPPPEKRYSFGGDFRLRQEASLDQEGKPDRYRLRVRMRMGARWQVDDEVEVGTRLVTGDSGDPRSPHSTFGDGFDGLEVSLDRAYATYRPVALPSFWVTGGKFSHPLRRNPVYGELVWDGDIQPEGIALGQSVGSVDLALGHFALLESSKADDAWVTFLQAATETDLSEETRGRLSASYTFVNDAAAALGDNRGNALAGGDFVSSFGVLDVIGDLTLRSGVQPWTLAAEWIENLRASEDERGWALGAAWGSQSEPGDWRLAYQLQSIQRDAVFSPLVQDDFLLATDHKSHLVSVERKLSRAVQLRLWSLISKPESGGSEEWRVRLDLNIRF